MIRQPYDDDAKEHEQLDRTFAFEGRKNTRKGRLISTMDLAVHNTNASIPTSIFHLSERNKQAGEVIKDYALRHTLTDIGIGLVGTYVPIPGSGIAALIASMLVQAPMFYQPMVKKLTGIYATQTDENTQDLVIRRTGTRVLGDLATEFGAGFLRIIFKLLRERNISLGVGFIPVIGGVASAALDATFATTLTWRIGKMVAIYYQYGGWIGNQEGTYERAKLITPWSLRQENNLEAISEKNPEVLQKHREWVLMLAKELKQGAEDMSNEQLLATLRSQGLPEQAINNVVDQL